MQRSKLPYFFLGLASILAIAALVLLVIRPGVMPPKPKLPDEAPKLPTVPNKIVVNPDQATPSDQPIPKLDEPEVGLVADDPKELINSIAKAFETGDLPTLDRLIAKEVLSPDAVEQLKVLTAGNVRLLPANGIREVGEIELNTRTRWALELEGQDIGRDKIFIDLVRKNGKWSVEKLTLPPTTANESIPKAVLADSLAVADGFLQAVLRQDFEFARAFVDTKNVSDAKIAGLCILFEEGGYTLRKSKPLRSMFQRPDAVGYLANVETTNGKERAQFTLALKQPPAPSNWVVTEINLDQLLADYARRLGDGDVYYSPLVKNPAGGETLALYFEFDEDEMNPRTRRQLEIVSMILRADPGKKITLSGHTDSLGTENYNNNLSNRRADVVKAFLEKAGVNVSQISTLGKGASQPRRPNFTETGKDNPDGRRANRRTEIYLDF